MSDRSVREPSPLRSGIVHTTLSFAAYSSVAAIAVAAIHFTGEPSAASPSLQIALFEPSDIERPQLKTRFASNDAASPAAAMRADGTAANVYEGADDEPSLGVDYDDGARLVRASMDDSDKVRINGVSVASGQSWQETREVTALPRAPISDVSERTSLGYLPKIAEDGRTPAGAYARPFANPENRPTVSIVLGGLGINYTHTKSAIEELPPEVTLSFAPTARNLQTWIHQARAAGHEVLLEVPMEPYEYGRERPNPQALAIGLSENELNGRLDYLMSRATGYFGITNYQGSKFATDETATAEIAAALAERGVAFVEDGSLNRSAFVDAAKSSGLRYRQANMPIDARPDGSEIENKLLELEVLALENGSSLGSGFAYPITIDILKAWTEQLDEKGIALAPVSAVTRARPKPVPPTVVEEPGKVDTAEAGQDGKDTLSTAG
ncbi:divergent polysaccharide deacetylase family protein [Henriciella sp. AS95]|uniref:divergent polysaccharide deacetylase family protein n=1 Tax=Henriciella sp. AS95 TaxID=3135782 RepID=UPI00317E7969